MGTDAKRKVGSFEGTPITHTNFKGAVDSDTINTELLSEVGILSECTNLTPFRKIGSLSMPPRHKLKYTQSQLPQPTGFKLVDFSIFTMDRESKEIYILVYKSTTTNETKMYISSYWNPTSNYSNYNELIPYYNGLSGLGRGAGYGWNTAWMEITEKYTLGKPTYIDTTHISIAHSNIAPLNKDWSGYFRGWFIYNTLSGLTNKKNFITDSSSNETTLYLTLQSEMNWGSDSNETMILMRFPVIYNYNRDTINYFDNVGYFNGLPTQFISKENQLRMPCGEDSRPLILDMIYKKKYFYRPAMTLQSISNLNILSGGEYTTKSGSSLFEARISIDSPEVSGTTATATSVLEILDIEYYMEDGFTYGTYNGELIANPSSPATMDVIVNPTFTLTYSAESTTFTIINKGEFDSSYYIPTDVIPNNQWTFKCSFTGDSPELNIFVRCIKFGVKRAIITENGDGYTSVPDVTFSSVETDIQATAEAVLTHLDYSEFLYDGLWFDLQQIPQTFKNSPSSAFLLGSATEESCWINDGSNVSGSLVQYYEGSWTPLKITSVNGTINFEFTLIIDGDLWNSIISQSIATVYRGGYTRACLVYADSRYKIYITSLVDGLLCSELKQMFVTAFGDNISCTYLSDVSLNYVGYGAINGQTTNYGSISYHSATFDFKEADGILAANNPFLGMSTLLTRYSSGETCRNAYILSALIDNRNEVIMSQGLLSSTDGIELSFDTWFSRRITGWNLYNLQLMENITSLPADTDAHIICTEKYPFFNWMYPFRDKDNKSMAKGVHDIPLFNTYDIYDINTNPNGEIKYKIHKPTESTNSYTFHKDTGVWKVKLTKDSNGINNSGLGIKFIANTNRYIDQDITMNYTRATFVGQTNGRYFIAGCKNSIEDPELESSDMIFPNNYAVGVSQYDIILRNSNINIGLGDKDIVRDLSNYKGYLTIVKDNNIFGIDVNTDDDSKYRTVDTLLGSGTTNVDSLCYTRYGIIVPTNDSVYLVMPDNIVPLMTIENSRLNTYKSQYVSATNVFSAFYKLYNELMIYLVVGSDTYVWTYSFTYKYWALYKYTGIIITKANNDSSRNINMLNTKTVTGTTTFNILQLTEDSTYQYIKSDGTELPIDFNAVTHYLPYGAKLRNVRTTEGSLTFDYATTSSDAKVNIQVTGNNEVILSKDVTLDSTVHTVDKINQLQDTFLTITNFSTMLKVGISNTVSSVTKKFKKFNLNSLSLWIVMESRVPKL